MNSHGRMTWTDTLTRLATGLTVAGLTGVAGAISFSHMSTLAAEHGQLGWKANAFPVSVDGLELVAGLFILNQHRAQRRPGILPWLALVVGTVASLAVNIAVGGHDTVGRALAGWPAVSLLVSIKLLFGMFDHDTQDRQTPKDDRRTETRGPSVPGTTGRTVLPGCQPSGTAPRLSDGPRSGTAGAPTVDARLSAERIPPVDIGAIVELLPAARAAHAALAGSGRALSRDALASRMRQDGYTVPNARLSLLLKALRVEPWGKRAG